MCKSNYYYELKYFFKKSLKNKIEVILSKYYTKLQSFPVSASSRSTKISFFLIPHCF